MTSRDSLPGAVARVANFARELDRPCALIGGVAVIARVFVRATKDVVLLVSCPVEDAPALLEVARRSGYAWDEADVADFLAAGLIRMWGPPSRREGLGLDILLTDSAFNEDVVRRATRVEVLGTDLAVATSEDLLLMKLEASRPVDVDVDDAIAIKDAFGEQLDRAYLARQGDALGLRRELENLLGPLGT